jgi:hypothetical protein
MSFNFPTSPSTNDLYSFGNKTWKYNGTGWVLVTNVDVAQTAWNKANLANVQANTGTVLAQGAFDNSNTKFSSSGGTINGSVGITQNLSVTGNLTVLGSSTSINTSSFTVQDTLLLLGLGNYTSDLLDIGFVSHYNDGTNAHTGIIRDASEKQWMFFEDYTPEVSPNNNIIITDPSFRYSNVRVRDVTGNLVANTVHVNGYNLFDYTTNSFAHANGAYDQANSSANYANSAFNYANSAYTTANNALANTTGTFDGDLTISGNLIVNGANVALGNVGNVHIYGGNTGQIITTDNNGNLSFIDLPTPNTISYTANTLTLTNGVYVSGNVTDTQVLNDGLYYQLTDGTGPAPAWILTFEFTGITKFNRIVSNIDYTLASGHIIYFQLYNYTTSFTLASGTVTTTSGANTVTVSSTTGMSVGQTIKFGTNVGNLVAGNTYYILSVPTPGQLTVGTGTSAASIVIQSDNSVTSTVIIESWDNLGSYSGASGFEQSAHEVLDYTAYVSSGVVTARLYHSNQGNASHISKIDYFALQQSFQGGQGPRGATGATGPTGPTGPGVATGGTVGQILIKNSSTNYDTSWSNNLINAYNGANSAGSYANSAFSRANNSLDVTTGGIVAGNVTANSFIANTSVYSPIYYSPSGTTNLTLSDIGIVAINSGGQETKFGGSGIESIGVYSGSYGGNKISLNNETNVISNRYDVVKIQTGTTGSISNEWSFSNNTLIFPDSTVQRTAWTGAAGVYANAAFGTANSAASYANAAFIQANAVYQYANTLSPQDNVARGTANSAALYANGAFVQSNAAFLQANTPSGTANSGALYANAAFLQANASYGQANSAATYANGAFIQANASFGTANSAALYANGAFLQANASFGTANSGASYANSAYTQANTATTNAATADSKAVTAGNYANSAFGVANSASLYANGAFIQANASFTTANNALPKSGGTLTGSLTVNGDLIINGTTTTVNTTTVSTTDSLIKLANNNTSGDSLDIGFYGVAYTGGQVTYQGLARQAGTNNFLLFKGLTQDPSGNTLGGGSATAANVGTLIANVAGYSITSNGVDLFLYTTNAYTQANTGVTNAAGASLYANAAFLAANAADGKSVTSGSYANSAFNTANSAALYANGAFVQSNASYGQANSAGSYANSAFLAANTADGKAVTSGSYANSAYTQANTATTNASTADGKAVTAGSYANSAFDTANSAALYANGAFLQANASFGQANSAASYANAAFAKANTFTGTFTVTSSRLSYTANGVAGYTGNTFNTPTFSTATQVRPYINGVRQFDTEYTLGSSTISFATTPPSGDLILIEVDAYTVNPYGTSATITDDTTTNGTRYLLLSSVTNTSLATANTSTTKLSFNPSTGTLSVPTIQFTDGTTQSTSSASASSYANAAFIQANAVYQYANTLSPQDNVARGTANSAALYANGAFIQANSSFGVANNALPKSGGQLTGAVSSNNPIIASALTSNTTVSINGVGFDVSNTFTTASTAQVSVDSFATATYRSARYFVQMTSSTSYHIIELFLVHDGTTVYLSQYGEVFTGSSLGTFDASITTGTLNLLFTATNAITTVKLIRRSIVV